MKYCRKRLWWVKYLSYKHQLKLITNHYYTFKSILYICTAGRWKAGKIPHSGILMTEHIQINWITCVGCEHTKAVKVVRDTGQVEPTYVKRMLHAVTLTVILLRWTESNIDIVDFVDLEFDYRRLLVTTIKDEAGNMFYYFVKYFYMRIHVRLHV